MCDRDRQRRLERQDLCKLRIWSDPCSSRLDYRLRSSSAHAAPSLFVARGIRLAAIVLGRLCGQRLVD